MNEDAQVNQLFNLIPDQDGKFANSHRGRVYGVDGIAPCMHTCGGGNLEPKILEEMTNDKGILRMVRTEEEKLRRSLHEDAGARFSGKTAEMRTDECSNTLTGVTKDNLLAEPHTCAIRTRAYCGKPASLEQGDVIANALTSVQKDSMVIEPMVMRNPAKRYGEVRPSGELAPTLLATDYKSPGIAVFPAPKIIGYSRDHKGNIVGHHLKDTANTLCPGNLGGVRNTAQYVAQPKDTTTINNNDMEQEKEPKYRIRKLTPRECFRLMDVDDADIDKIQSAGISKSQQYKLAGNSIVVSCLYHIFKNLITNETPANVQLTLF